MGKMCVFGEMRRILASAMFKFERRVFGNGKTGEQWNSKTAFSEQKVADDCVVPKGTKWDRSGFGQPLFSPYGTAIQLFRESTSGCHICATKGNSKTADQ
jgi:hypothetical protein